MAGTSKSRSLFVTTTADEDETSESNPENSKRDAVDVSPSVPPAPEDEAAAEPALENEAAAEPTTSEPGTAETITAEPTTAEPTSAEPTTSEPGTAEPITAEPTTADAARRGPVVQELDLTLDNPTDRDLFQLGTLPTEMRTAVIHHGPCRPKEGANGVSGNPKKFGVKIKSLEKIPIAP